MKRHSNGTQSFFNTIKKVKTFRLIGSVPPELNDQFNQFQLETSISRIRILGILFGCIKLLIIALSFRTNEILGGRVPVSLLDYVLLANFILYNLFVYYYSHKDKNYRQLWAVCYIHIFFYCVITLLEMATTGTSANAPGIILELLCFAVISPDFKPKIFISFLVFLYAVVAFISLYNNEMNDDFIENLLFISMIFITVTVIKFALYHEKVRTFKHMSRIINERLFSANEKLSALSTTDELTKLNNRRAFLEYMDIVWKQNRRLKLPVTVLMIDVDYFKKYNDSLGHLEGDKALIAIAQCMKNSIKRETDFVARFGGEEFVCLLTLIEKDEAVDFAKTLVANVEGMKIPHPMSEHSKYLTISAGMASIVPDNNNSQTQLLDEADKALYMAKETGRNKVVVK
jgi:diguanylate cyclase (GGDEF)-like protein